MGLAGGGPQTRLWVRRLLGPGPPRTARQPAGRRSPLPVQAPPDLFWTRAFLNCQSKYEGDLHLPEKIPRQEGAGQGGGSGEDSLLGNVQGSSDSPAPVPNGHQGGAFAQTFPPTLFQDILGTGESALGFFMDGRSSSPTPCVGGLPRVPAASHGCDTPTKESRRGAGEAATAQGPSVAHKPSLALR